MIPILFYSDIVDGIADNACVVLCIFSYFFIRFTLTLFNYIIDRQNKTVMSIASIIERWAFCCRISNENFL